jgi:hypothetical protein
MATLTKDMVSWITDQLDDETIEPYSGRGMNGRVCLSIRFDSLSDAFAFGVAIGDDSTLARLLMNGAEFDDMGRGIVVYWPGVEIEDGALDDDDEDLDDEEEV